jgi:hypothetical protein
MDAELRQLIAERRKDIEDSAPCEGCGATRAFCKSQRGRDPKAPEWFGCCARGTAMVPCAHRTDAVALRGLLQEIESGEVRSVEEVMLDSIEEFPMFSASRRGRALRAYIGTRSDPRDRLHPAEYYAREEDS